jgi:hypothetical protein
LDQARFGVPPNLNQGVIRLPTGAGTTTFPKEDLREPIHSWNVFAQHEFTHGLTGQIGYVGSHAEGQQGFININASAPGTGNAGRPLAPLGIVNDINMIMPFGPASYKAMQSEMKWRYAATGYLGVTYTLARATNYQDNDANPRIPWLPARELNKGPASYDRTHNLQTYWAVDLPFGDGHRWATDGLTSVLLGGWQFNGVMSIMSGQPINIIQGNGANLNAGGSGQYPDQVKSDVEILGGVGAGNPYFDTTAYAAVNIPANEAQRFGNSGRNPIRGPGYFNVDLGLFRTIRIYSDRVRLQLRFEALNALNHPNFANPGGDISNAGTFGIISATTGTGERNLRFGARLTF